MQQKQSLVLGHRFLSLHRSAYFQICKKSVCFYYTKRFFTSSTITIGRKIFTTGYSVICNYTRTKASKYSYMGGLIPKGWKLHKFGRDWSQKYNIYKSQSGTGPGVEMNKRPLMACQTPCKCSTETSSN